MNTLLIYDNSGYIYLQMSGAYRKPEAGIQFLEVEVPDGKIITGIDITVTPNIPIYTDLPIDELDSMNTRLKNSEALINMLLEML